MSPWAIVGALLSLAEVTTHWPILHYLTFVYGAVSWALVLAAWWRARTSRPPLAVVYGCPYRCGYLGDEVGVGIHMATCLVAKPGA